MRKTGEVALIGRSGKVASAPRRARSGFVDVVELKPTGLFSDLLQENRAKLADVMKVEDHPVGAVLVAEGDLPSKFFVLLEGHVTVHRQGQHVVDLGPDDFFGEIGVLSLEERNASVIATTPVKVAVAMGWDLRRVLDELPTVRQKLENTAASRHPYE